MFSLNSEVFVPLRLSVPQAKARPVAPFASLLSAPTVVLTVSTVSSNTVTVSSAGASAACAIFVKLTLQFKNGTDVPYAIFGRNYFWLTVRAHCSSPGLFSDLAQLL